jgi:hypothetical protein
MGDYFVLIMIIIMLFFLFGFVFGAVIYRQRERKTVEVSLPFINNEDSRDYFTGIEAEGPFKGILTLFIASDTVDPERILEYLKSHKEIENVYFGANDTCYLPDKYISLVKSIWDIGRRIIIEIDHMGSSEYILSKIPNYENIYIVYTIEDEFLLNQCLQRNCMIKFSGEKIKVLYSSNMDLSVTERNDVRFSLDKKVSL